jgi:hypothetical protein
MKPTHLLAGLFTIAAVLFDVVVAQRLSTAPDAALTLFFGAACGQLALLSVWCVWGFSAWLIRLVAVLVVAALLSVPLATATAGQWSEWFLVLCLFAGLVGVPLIVARWSGLSAAITNTDNGQEMAGRRLRRGQYSLGGLLSLMTAVGIACGLRHHVAFPWPHALALASYGTCLTCVAVGSVWAMVSRQPVGVRILVLTMLCIAAGLVMNRTELARDIWFFTVVVFGEAVVICFGLNVRLAGGLRMDWSRARR